MLEHQPRCALKAAAEAVQADGLALKILDGFILRPGDDNGGDTRCVTSNDSDRYSPNRRGNPRSNHRLIIDFSAHQCRQSNSRSYSDQFRLEPFLLEKARLFTQGKREKRPGRIRIANSN